jgi:hypothetical protein
MTGSGEITDRPPRKKLVTEKHHDFAAISTKVIRDRA